MPLKIASQNPVYNNQTPAQRDAIIKAEQLAVQIAKDIAAGVTPTQPKPVITGLAMRAVNRGTFM